MCAAIRVKVILFVLSSLFFGVTALPAYALQNDPCPNQGRIATAADAGYPLGSKICPTGEKILNGGCDFNPYPILEGSFKTGSGVQITPSSTGGDLKDGINPALACRIVQFFRFAQTQGCTFKIKSAYRSAQTQANVCKSICGNPGGCTGSAKCGVPGNSCHQYGLATDITSTPQCMSWAQKILGVGNTGAVGAQQFKIFFPMPSDAIHLQCIENTVGACSVSTKACDGSIRINPDLSGIPGPQSSPSSQLSDAIRRAMGQQPPPPPQPPMQPQPTLPPQPALPVQPTLPTQSPSSSVSSQITPISDIINTNTNTNTNTKSTSTIDLIDEFLNPVSDSIDIGTAVDIALNPDTSDATSLDAKRPASINASGTLAMYQTVSVPQTFTSNDLANSPVAGYVTGENTFMLRLLETMKNTLLLALSYLKPFGGYPQAQLYGE